MNKRIKELMTQSIDYAGANQKSMDTAMEKFAELIVKECAEFADQGTRGGIGELMKKHFGVEE